jgi:hypothetical protein
VQGARKLRVGRGVDVRSGALANLGGELVGAGEGVARQAALEALAVAAEGLGERRGGGYGERLLGAPARPLPPHPAAAAPSTASVHAPARRKGPPLTPRPARAGPRSP